MTFMPKLCAEKRMATVEITVTLLVVVVLVAIVEENHILWQSKQLVLHPW